MIPPHVAFTVPLEPADAALYARFAEALRPAWSPPVALRHAAEIDGKPATVEIRRAER